MDVVESTTAARDREAPRSDTLLIDTDVHEDFTADHRELVPYLDSHWQRYVTGEGGVWFGLDTGDRIYAMPLAKNGYRADWNLPDGTAGNTDPDAMARHLFEEGGVTHAILNGFFHITRMQTDPEFAVALASAYNDWQIEQWLEKDPRILGSVHVVANQPERAAREIDRVAGHPQIVQVFLANVTNCQYGDPFFRPIYEAAIRNDLVVTLHHGPHSQTAFGFPHYFIEWHTLAAPHLAACQITSLICQGTFDKYPELKVVVLESGVAWVPWLMWRLDQQYRELRSNVPWVTRLPSNHMRDNVRVSTQPLSDVSPKHFEQLVEMTDSDRIFLFASDYPHYDADSAKVVLPGTFSHELRQRIRYQNALETYPRLKVIVE